MFQLYVEYFDLRASGPFAFESRYIYFVIQWPKVFLKALITLIRFKKCAFSLSSIMHRSIRVYATVFDGFSTVHTKTFENDRIARCDVSWTICACFKHTRMGYFRSSFSFWSVLNVHTNMICICFLFDPLSRAFSNRCVFDEKAHRIIVDGKPSWCTPFKTKTH